MILKDSDRILDPCILLPGIRAYFLARPPSPSVMNGLRCASSAFISRKELWKINHENRNPINDAESVPSCRCIDSKGDNRNRKCKTCTCTAWENQNRAPSKEMEMMKRVAPFVCIALHCAHEIIFLSAAWDEMRGNRMRTIFIYV